MSLDYPTTFDAIGWQNLGLPFWYGKRHDQPSNGTNSNGSYNLVTTKWLAANDKRIVYLYRNQLEYSRSQSGADDPSVQLYIYDGNFIIEDGEFLGGEVANGYSIKYGHGNPRQPFTEFNTYEFTAPLRIGKGIPNPDLRLINNRLSARQWINYSKSTGKWHLTSFSGSRTSTGQWSQRSDSSYEAWNEVKAKLTDLGFPDELLLLTFNTSAGGELGVFSDDELSAYLAIGFNPDPDYKIELPSLYFVDATNISPDRSQFVNGHVRTGNLVKGAWLNYRYRLNGSEWSEWADGEVGSNEFRIKQDGQYQVEVRQIDGGANRSSTITSNFFNVDLTPPAPRINRVGNSKSIIDTSGTSKLIGSRADTGRDIEIRSGQWKATTKTDSNGNFSYAFDSDDIASLGQGKKAFRVFQYDSYGNLGSSRKVNATIRTLGGTKSADRLTGRHNIRDTFTWNSFADAKIAKGRFDVITNYRPEDKIRIRERSYNLSIHQPDHRLESFSLKNLSSILTSKSFKPNDVAAIQTNEGTFLAFNDGKAGFSSKSDSLIFLNNYFVYQGGYNITIV